jgi:hypothetical protein
VEKHSRFTLLFVRLAIDVMRECSKPWAVRRGLASTPARVLCRVCVGEKNIGARLGFVTVMSCLDGLHAMLECNGNGRCHVILDQFWLGQNDSPHAGVQADGM